MPKKTLIAVLSVLIWLIPGCAVNPLTGDEEFMLLSEKQDLAIGSKYAPEIEQQLGGKIENDQLQKYIESVGEKITRVSHRQDIEYHFTAVEHESINALALPGGYIFITRGLLEKLTTEAQLASVLAHEVAHVVSRDTANMISKEIGMTILLAATIVTGQAPGEVINAAVVTQQILGLSYSRNDERQADFGGMRYMFRAGYNPKGMVETMEIFQKQPGEKPPEFFSTHPSPKNRLSYLNRTIKNKYSTIPGLTTGSEEYRKNVFEALKCKAGKSKAEAKQKPQ
jgi:predicted Zn-dependent protease